MEEYIARNALTIANEKQEHKTFEGPCGSSNIDVTLTRGCKNAVVQGWRVLDGITQSDHNLITFEIRHSRTRREEPPPRLGRLRIIPSKFRRLRITVMRRLAGDLPSPQNAEDTLESANRFMADIIGSSNETFSQITPGKRIAPWWSEKLDELKRECYKARKQHQRAKTQSSKLAKRALFLQARGTYIQAVSQAKHESWHKFVNEQSEENIWKTVKIFRNKHHPRRLMTTSTMHGTMTWEEAVDHLLNHFFQRDAAGDDTEDQKRIRRESRRNPGNSTSRKIEEEEIKEIIKKLRKKITPGLDCVENEVLVAIADIVTPRITVIFNACLAHGVFPTQWKEARLVTVLKSQDKDKGSADSYRPICLLSAIGKIFEKIIRDRIEEHIQIGPSQYGFKKGSSTTNAIEQVIKLVRSSKEKKVIIVMVDIASAFDSLWWPQILVRLRRTGCPGDVYAVMRDYLRNRKVTLVDGPASKTIVQEKGCPQGSVLGPTLWNIIFDELLDKLNGCEGVSPIAYADDLTMVVSGQSRGQLERRAQRAMDETYDWCTRSKMRISEEKTCCLIGKGVFRDGTPEIRSNTGKLLPFVKAAKYLGVTIDQGIKFHTHCQDAAEKAKISFQAYRAIAKVNWGIKNKQLTLLYKAIFVPRIAYGAGAWAKYATKADLAKLATAQRAALLTVTRAYRTISTSALLVIAGQPPIEKELQKERLRYAIRTIQAIQIDGQLYDPTTVEGIQLLNKLEDTQLQTWQENWESNTKGRATFEFFPSIAERLQANWVEPTYYLTQYLCGHGNFRSKLRKFSLSRNDRCQCGSEDTPYHTFFECSRFNDLRAEYREQVMEVGTQWQPTWAQTVTRQLMAATATYVTSVLKNKELWDKDRRD